ncbi:hypothetical protein HanXRQr2_Chr05g0196781 [Helianthus annuus]|uniref:Uncharacterized protein n=1 Tax=Helianthus annuus TaxID=4232 RepID=A0A9K3IX06_HELAN|nr:hypothetical protein HanXRQr2_Chr05g0196781 [Helianthus annuus]
MEKKNIILSSPFAFSLNKQVISLSTLYHHHILLQPPPSTTTFSLHPQTHQKKNKLNKLIKFFSIILSIKFHFSLSAD